MKKRIILSFITLLLVLSSIQNTSIDAQDNNKIKNVILIIGDGMGFPELELASYVEYGNNNSLFMQNSSFIQSKYETSSSDQKITDSAASATAIATGVKTKNGYLGVDKSGNSLQTILEYAQTLGKATGLITTTRYNHATPAAFASHVNDRDATSEITNQMSNANVTMILGGGTGAKLPDSTLQSLGYTVVSDKTSFENLNVTNISKLFGTFANAHIPYVADIDYNTTIRLSQMVSKGLTFLENQANGFFLMVEGGRIDHAGHERNLERNVLETIELDKSIKIIQDWQKNNPDTLVLIGGDHETGGLTITDANNLDTILPNENNSEEENRVIRLRRVNQMNAVFTTSGHMPWIIPFFSFGKNADLLINPSCDYSNAHLYKIMKNGFDGVIPTSCPDPIPGYTTKQKTPASTTTSTSTTSTVTSSTSTTTSSSSSTSVDATTEDTPLNNSWFILSSILTIIYTRNRNKKKL